MTGELGAALSAAWLGILTSVSPCPLATNIAAVAFVGRRIESPFGVFLSGVLYTFGRTLAYAGLAILLVAGAQSAPLMSDFLQRNMNKILGPLLMIVALILLEVIRLPSFGATAGMRMQERAERMGLAGAMMLGIVFALSFCPLSAALFFGSLLPLTLKSGSSVLLPSIYGIGTGLPVLAFGIVLATGVKRLAYAFDRVRQVEVWARRATGVVFLCVGLYYLLTHVFRVEFG